MYAYVSAMYADLSAMYFCCRLSLQLEGLLFGRTDSVFSFTKQQPAALASFPWQREIRSRALLALQNQTYDTTLPQSTSPMHYGSVSKMGFDKLKKKVRRVPQESSKARMSGNIIKRESSGRVMAI
jgi:hypothetical protein